MSELSVVTPSRNMLPYLRRAVASVADQNGVRAEHIVVDALSADGSAAWLAGQPGVRCLCEADAGMYDAVNKGLRLASAPVLAYLNCDEQYLPSTLAFVNEYFARRPDVDLLFGDLLLVRPDGTLIAFRRGYAPRWPYIAASHLYVLSCAMFFRRRLVDDGHFFDPRYRFCGDQEWVVRVLRAGYRARHVRRFLAAFTMTGGNLSEGEPARAERRRLAAAQPWPVRAGRLPLQVARLAEKLLSGAYCSGGPLEYEIRVDEGPRRRFRSERPSWRWRSR